MKKKLRQMLCLILMVGIILTGCSVHQTSQEPLTDDIVDVAVILPLSGIASLVGHDFYNGMLLAQNQINNSNIRLYVEDTQTEPKEAVTAVTKLINEQDIDVIVSIQAQTVLPLQTIADEYDIPLVASLASLEDYTRSSENAFLLYELPEEDIQIIGKFIDEKGFESMATLTVLDDFGSYFKNKFIENFNVLTSEEYEKSNVDYKTQLLKIKEKNPDAIFVIGYPPHLMNILKQRKELGMDHIPIISTVHIQSNYVRNNVGELLENVYASVPYSLVTDSLDEFAKDFSEEFGVQPDFVAPYGYDTYSSLHEVEQYGGDVQEALLATSFKGINGKLQFNEFGELDFPLVVIHGEDKTIVTS